MQNKKLGGMLLSFSLLTNFIAPTMLAKERSVIDVEGNQLKLADPLSERERLNPLTNEFEKPDEETDDNPDEKQALTEVVNPDERLSEETADSETPQIRAANEREEVRQNSESEATIVDQGTTESGEWNVYSDGLLTITGNVTAATFTEWQPHEQAIKAIEFLGSGQDNLSGDFSWTFSNYKNLESVDFGAYSLSGVTSFEGTFSSLNKLKRVSFKDVTYSSESSLTNMAEMFNGCIRLVEVDLSGLDTSFVTNMDSLFYDCSGLTVLDLSGFNTSSVTNMRVMFKGCSYLAQLNISGFDTSSVTNMVSMFGNCFNLTELDVSGFNTSSVTDMGKMFIGCSSLTELDVSGFDTSSVTNMETMFNACSRLSELDVSGFDTSSVISMYSMFGGCSGLKELDVSGFDTSSVTNMMEMFKSCSKLSELDVTNFNTSALKRMDGMFSRCEKLTSLDVSGFDTSSVTFMDSVFNGCIGLRELDVSGFDTRSVQSMYGMFKDCSGLTQLDVSGFDTSSVKYTNRMFRGCSGLTKLDVSGFDMSSVTYMEEMFADCSRLSELDISGFDTSIVMSMSNLFEKDLALSIIHVSGRFNFHENVNLPAISEESVWQDETKQLFSSNEEMMSYHNGANTTNTYRKVVQVELIMDAMGGKFNDGASTALQRKVINESWEEIIPTKETDIFDGWYVDKGYTKKFDFSQPASQSLTIYAKWVEEYTVTIPAKVSLNSDDKLKVAATNNGEKTVEVNLINDPTQLNAESQLLLSNQKDAALKITSQLTWEPMSEQSKWNVLTVAPAENGSSKESVIHLTKPKNARAGSYEGTVTFNITYQ